MRNRLILVAVDHSDACAAACRVAEAVADALDAELRVLHVKHPNESGPTDHTAWLDELLPGQQVVTVTGTPWVQIARYAEEIQPTFLVVGSHGRGGYQPLTPGSTTTLLLARSPVPVLVVPSKPLPGQRDLPAIVRHEERALDV